MTKRVALVVAATAAMTMGTGCGQRLTPELVRGYLDDPQGVVDNDTMTRVTRDLFRTDGATAAEGFVNLLKLNQGGGDTANALPIQTGVLEDMGDVFCVGGLVAGIATFDGCELGNECDAELTIDSCLLRVGEADEEARGKIKLGLKNSVVDDANKSELGVEFQGWESSIDDELLTTFEGQIALEITQALDNDAIELVFASDFEAGQKRKERGLFDDGVEERTRMSAGLRFAAETDDLGGRGRLDILTFVDEDGGQSESVSVTLAAEGHRFDAGEATASASLEVHGGNGTFVCTWSGSSSDANRDGLVVESQGECVDEDGEVFSFEGTATDH
jgi:hypothetical protein